MEKASTPYQYIIKIMILCLVCSQIACKPSEGKKKSTQPNIIVILTDDQGWGDLSLNGNTQISTPNIDKLAENGTVVERFYVNSVCSPTRAEILTGRYHVRGGVYSTSEGGERLDLDETTIANIFKDNGYKTAAFGKWHSGTQAPYHPNTRGFDEYYGFTSGHWGNYFSPMLDHNGEIVNGKGFLPDDLTNHALDFIETNKDEPFFIYIPYNTPHSPMQVPDRWWNKFKDKDIAIDHRYKNEENIAFTKAAYALCENIDWNVGRINTKINDLHLEENTIIVYLSDNGPNSYRYNGELKGKKGHTDEGGVRVPFIIDWKGTIPSGKKIKQIAGSIDILPTLADLADIEVETEKPLDGISLKPLLTEEKPEWEDRYLVTYWKKNISLRNEQFMLDQDEKLFDLLKDPQQNTDISLQYPEQLKDMIAYKKHWVEHVLSELPEKDTRTNPVGYAGFKHTQLPARDASPHGNIKRSNRWPNDSFLTDWTSTKDSITWNVEVLESGNYEAVVYYTCSKENVGSTIQLSFDNQTVNTKITEPHNPPLVGFEKDRILREESYVKDFKPLNMGTIKLTKQENILTLKAINKAADSIMDFRLLTLKKIN
ncbi:arylsulfatase [uncultured Algibacter sp.]|uniref:arylsulfatase n=1 Tax=uncultured Algibacter sp. TaxID=298659 RepID=UPI002610E25F|nr:arylsulfatase [uncultured Algibacter sp.]